MVIRDRRKGTLVQLEFVIKYNLKFEMEENKKIEFESYLESQGLDKETEEKIAKDKSDKLARIQEIKTDESMNAADKIQEILAIITSKVRNPELSIKKVKRVKD